MPEWLPWPRVRRPVVDAARTIPSVHTAADEEDHELIDLLTTALSPDPGTLTATRTRVWATVEARIRTRPPRRTQPARALVAVALVVALGLGSISPLGQHMAEAAQQTIQQTVKIMLVRINPDGTHTHVEAQTVQVGNSVVITNGLMSVAEAEQRAGFTARLPRDLPAGSRLLGAQVSTGESGQAGNQIALTYAVGDEVLTLTQTRGAAVRPAPAGGIVAVGRVTIAPNATPAAGPAQPAEPLTAVPVPLHTETQTVAVGNTSGTLTTRLRPDGTVLDRQLSWTDGELTFEMMGNVSADDLLRIARSIASNTQ